MKSFFPPFCIVVVYSTAIFLSATLLFTVQPMFARMVLPTLGGAPAVWNAAMLFYQAVLLAAYYYAHRLSLLRSLKTQVFLHVAVLFFAFLFLPIALASGSTPPHDGTPVMWLLWQMLVSVGLPCFALSATSPLFQKWFSCTSHRQAGDPYFLYVASNIGSLLGLMAYPLVVERFFDAAQQGRFWGMAYGAFVCVAAICGCTVAFSARVGNRLADESCTNSSPLSWRQCLAWVGLAFIPSSLMLGFTVFLTTDIAAVPLLWIVPLGAYLITFQIAFSNWRNRFVIWFRPLLPWLIFASLLSLCVQATGPKILLLPIHFLAFFGAALVCHGKLAEMRPSSEHITGFYFLLSVGGVLGGLFCALLAPLIFPSVWEYPLTLLAFLAFGLHLPDALGKPDVRWKREFCVAAMFVLGMAVMLGIMSHIPFQNALLRNSIFFGIPALLAFSVSRLPFRFAMMMGILFFMGQSFPSDHYKVLDSERSFFGVHRVKRDDNGGFHHLYHGMTLHGTQSFRSTVSAGRAKPLSYYHVTGPLGDFFECAGKNGVPKHALKKVALVGLGAGAAVYYAKPGETWDIYELDPAVCRYASDPRYFTFLRDCKAPYNIILGDGRVALSKAQNASYDLIVMDVYSSDSIPIHMMTREALELYFQKLSPCGVVLFHISNKHLSLEPVLANIAAAQGWAAAIREDKSLAEDERKDGKATSQWMAMARGVQDLSVLQGGRGWHLAKADPSKGIWSDQFSSVFAVFKWNTSL